MVNSKPTFSEIAAVDLGSNSFRLQLAKVVDGHLIFHDSLREVVRLGAGLSDDKTLSKEAQQRAIACLERFGERLRGLPAPAVRAVATNTFRVAKNAPDLLKKAQEALGFPIEIIAGREEARMIFVGVSHSLPRATHKRLVIDIGGGSTEFIVGEGLEPLKMESLYMGCVSYSMRYF
ncbi:MAG: exopolyphosphatase, partial [Methylophilaceae bacterium]|nr:exopolyphosphatase [Methylophilaceae bacterium]